MHRDDYNATLPEIAQELGISITSVKNIINRASEKFSRRLYIYNQLNLYKGVDGADDIIAEKLVEKIKNNDLGCTLTSIL